MEFATIINNIINRLLKFILSPRLQERLFILKFIFAIISAIFFVSIVILLIKTTWMKKRAIEDLIEITTYRPFGAKKIFKQWAKIIKRLETGREAEYKLAVIEADSLLIDIFKKMGYKGETMGELLKQLTSDILPDLDEIRQAHKIRNNVVYDPDYRLTLDQAKRTLQVYEKTLRHLEVF